MIELSERTLNFLVRMPQCRRYYDFLNKAGLGEDAIQEVWIKCHKKLDMANSSKSPWWYLMGVTQSALKSCIARLTGHDIHPHGKNGLQWECLMGTGTGGNTSFVGRALDNKSAASRTCEAATTGAEKLSRLNHLTHIDPFEEYVPPEHRDFIRLCLYDSFAAAGRTVGLSKTGARKRFDRVLRDIRQEDPGERAPVRQVSVP